MSKSNMNLKLVTGLLVASGSTTAVASMNSLEVQSHLGERFSGSIVVTGPTAQEILKSPSSVSVSGAPVSAKVSKQGTAAVIHLHSDRAINDPILRLKVSAGTESRHYSAIIDPKNPVHQQAQVNPAKAIPHPPVLAERVVATPAANAQAAKKQEAQRSASQHVAKPTIHPNRAQAQTRVSTKHTNTSTAKPAAVSVAQQYKVQANDTIFDIASRFQPEGLSTAQTVTALMRSNPHAFRKNNPNLLYGDATLNIPSAESMQQLATGRIVKPVSAAATTAAATTSAAVATTTAVTNNSSNANDVVQIQQQLSELEKQKAELEKQLAKAKAEADKAAATVDTSAAATTTTTAASETTAATPTTASATVSASAAVATTTEAASAAKAVPSKPKKAAPPPPVEEESGLMDMIVQYLPYLGGALLLLILAALLLRSRKQAAEKAAVAHESVDDTATDDDAIEVFQFDDASLEKSPESSLDNSVSGSLSPSELAALDAFNPEDEHIYHPSTNQPTVAPGSHNATLATGAAVLAGGAAVAASQLAEDNGNEQNFMPSDEELAQYAQPEATAAPELDDFNLDDLDVLLKQEDFTPSEILKPVEDVVIDDFDFDFNTDELVQNNTIGTSAPALDFPEGNALAAESIATNVPQTEELEFTGLDFTDTAALDKQVDANEFDFNLDDAATALAAGAVVATALDTNAPSIDASATENQSDLGLTLSEEDISAINFDDFDFESNEAVASTEVEASPEVASMPTDLAAETTESFEPSFDLNFAAAPTEAASEADASSDLDFSQLDIAAISQAEAIESPTQSEQADEYVSKFSSISTDTGHELAFDDSFDLNFDELLSLDADLNAPAETASAETNIDDALDLHVAPGVNSVETVDSSNSTVNTLDIGAVEAIASENMSSEPIQAWAGTGNFGNRPVTDNNLSANTSDSTVADDFDLDLNLDEVLSINQSTTAAPIDEVTETQVASELDLAAAQPQETTDDIAPNLTSESDDLSFDLTDFNTDAVEIAAPVATKTDKFDLYLNNLSTEDDAVTEVTAPAEVQMTPTAQPEPIHNFDFSLDDGSSNQTAATIETEASTGFELETFDLGSFSLEELDLDTTESTPQAAVVDEVQTSTGDAGLSFSLDDDATALQLDSFEPVAVDTEAVKLTDSTETTEELGLTSSVDAETNTTSDVDSALLLESLQHTQDAKLDLAQMYLDMNDHNNARDVLVDLIENGSEDIAARAYALYQNLQ